MKVNKTIKVIAIFVFVILISMVSFLGIYVKDKNTTKNLVKGYTLGADLKGVRRIVLVIDDSVETKKYDADGNLIADDDTTTQVATTENSSVNPEDVKTKENYILSRKIIEQRLKDLKLEDYSIRQNEENGQIVIEVPENEATDSIVAQIYPQGKMELVDSQNGNVLINNDQLKKITAGVGNVNSGYVAYFDIEFNKEGTEKLKDITNSYRKTKDEEGKETEKKVTLKIDGTEFMETSFEEEIANGKLPLTMGSAATSLSDATLQDNYAQAKMREILLNNGKMPNAYKVEQNKYIETQMTQEKINVMLYVGIALVVIGMLYLIVRYRKLGVYTAITLIGYIALSLLTIRYTNVALSIGGLIGIAISVLCHYLFTTFILKEEKEIEDVRLAFFNAMKKGIWMMIPVVIIAIVFTFASEFAGGLVIFSLGMTLFWGLVVSIIYHYTITKWIVISGRKD